MPQPAQFTGKNGDDPNGFISSLEHYFKFKNIVSEEAKFNQIRNLLHIDVRAVVQTLPLEERQTYNQIAQFITYNYSAVVDRERTRQEFNNRKQKPNEEHRAFWHALELLYNVGWRATLPLTDSNRIDRSDRIVNQFIDGVQNQTLRARLRTDYYPLWQANKLITKADAVVTYADTVSSQAQWTDTSAPRSFCTNCKTRDHNTRDCPNIRYGQVASIFDTNAFESLASADMESAPIEPVQQQPETNVEAQLFKYMNNKFKQFEQDREERAKTRECWRCGEKGHSMAQCPNAARQAEEQVRRDRRLNNLDDGMKNLAHKFDRIVTELNRLLAKMGLEEAQGF